MSAAAGAVQTDRLRIALEKAGLLAEVRGELPATIGDITDDSRAVKAGSCFVAVKGSTKDGHDYLPKAVEAGATCAIVERPMPLTIPSIVVREGRAASAVAAAAFHGEPAASLKFVGVTGTNGKTTTVGLLRHLLAVPDSSSASIGTLGVLLGSAGNALPGGAGLTTPGPVELQRVLHRLVDTRVKTVTMEVSSHALDQQRVLGVEFDAAVFTNLTRDHLDYHGTMESYLAAKAKLAGMLRPGGTAVVNADDPAWKALPRAPKSLSFSLTNKDADVRAESVSFEPRGSVWTLVYGKERIEVKLPLIGDFNVANALGAAAAAIAMGLDVKTVAARLAVAPQVPGRLEVLSQHPTVLRDYAHTPDALARALVALRPFVQGRLIALFGCGGDRDRGKRPLMAEAARANADLLVVTSDNPRTEDPERILDEIVAPLAKGSYDRIEDRRAAIAHAINLAHPESDVVLLAGKGHENYQIRGTTSYPFDEAVIVRELLGGGQVSKDFWSLARIAQALEGGPSDHRRVSGITTDTRTVKNGECFVALRGEKFDAHDFLAEAVKKGATAVVVEDARRTTGLGVPVYEVPDTLVALGVLARYRRAAWGRPVIAVGGSNGKTSTKELLKAALGSRLAVHATTGNLNNRIGVPLTLLALDDAADVAIIETGTNIPGEIATLREIVLPDVAVITTVQEEHLEGFGDLAGVMAEEMSLCDGIALAVVPGAEPAVVEQARRRAQRAITAQLPAAHGLHADGRGWCEVEGVRVEVPLRGAHNLRNASLALALAGEFGVSIADAAKGFATMPQPPMRSAVAPLGQALLLNDAYNSNPGSARAALALLRDVGGGRQRVAVLGTMRELGDQAERAHREVAEVALAGGHDIVCGIGEFAGALKALAPKDSKVITAGDVDDLWPQLSPRLTPDAAILLKASRGVKLERLVPYLTLWASA